MKNFGKLSVVLGGSLLAIGCGGSQDVVGGQAVAVAASDAAIKLHGNNPASIDEAKRDRLVGYYSGCEGFDELQEWSIDFGSGASGKDSPLKLTKGDTGCTLTATGFWHAERTFADAMDTTGTPSAEAKQFKFYRADDPGQLTSIQIAANNSTNPYNPNNASIARLVNAMGQPIASEGAESTMVNVGAYVLDGSNNPVNGILNMKQDFRIETITGTPGSLKNATGNANFIGYASMAGSPVKSVKAPAYVQGSIDALIYTNSKDVIISSDKFFRFNRAADVETGGTEYTYSIPGYRLQHDDKDLTPVTDASFEQLNDGQKFDLLRKAFDNLSGNQGQVGVNPSASAINIAASTLYPVGTDLNVGFAVDDSDPMNPVLTNADLSNRRTVVMVSRRDPKSGVRSYQAIIVRLLLNVEG